MKKKLYRLGVIIFSLSICYAQITPDVMYFPLNKKVTPTRTIELTNSSAENAYVKIKVFKVNNPGEKEKMSTEVYGIRDSDLIVTPKTVMIPAKSKKTVMARVIKPVKDFMLYQIEATPLKTDQVNDIIAHNEKTGASATSSLTIITSYLVNAFIVPNNVKPTYSVAKKDGEITITNTGNTRITFVDGKQCIGGDSENCKKVSGGKAYPGKSFTIKPFNQDDPVDFNLIYISAKSADSSSGRITLQ